MGHHGNVREELHWTGLSVERPLVSPRRFPCCCRSANIANTLVKAIADAPNAVTLGIASRSIESAKRWGAERAVPKAYGSYRALAFVLAVSLSRHSQQLKNPPWRAEEMLEDDEIDAVYIPLPTSLHLEWVVKTAQAGKHVLVEKPDAVNSAELETMLAACAKNKVQFMDSVMWMHNSRNGPLKAAIDSLGATRRVVSSFTFAGGPDFFKDNIRVRNDGTGDPLGCLGDLGWYNTRACLFAMGYKKPKWASAHAHANAAGVSMALTATLGYDDCLCSFDCGFETFGRNWLEVAGDTGVINVTGFTSGGPGKDNNSFVVTRGGAGGGEEVVQTDQSLSNQARMVEHFSKIVLSGESALEPRWARISLMTQQVVDALQTSWQQDGKKILL